MIDYVKAANADKLDRVSANRQAYTITLFGLLNKKLLINRAGYEYCTATGGNFKKVSEGILQVIRPTAWRVKRL